MNHIAASMNNDFSGEFGKLNTENNLLNKTIEDLSPIWNFIGSLYRTLRYGSKTKVIQFFKSALDDSSFSHIIKRSSAFVREI